MPPAEMKGEIERLFDENPARYTEEQKRLFEQFKDALNSGKIRAAEPNSASATGWSVNAWVKKGILLGFRMGAIVDMSVDTARQPFFDKSTYPVKALSASSGVRIVPGGSSIRDGCYVSKGVTCMPPMYVNVGAYVDEGTMIDSHALVGSCAQIGKKCHISAASQIGGVLEPVGALPVIVEDEVLIGGNCGVYEGTVVKRRAVLGTGAILNRSTPVYDVVTGAVHSASADKPLVIPENAVVVAGSRAISHGRGKDWNLSLYTPVIVKYRDAKTDAKVQLEDLLR
jgi:2,3,4,5-tetrahydropyridine-2,6-dicarboxylate N-succinyltransferase